MGFGKKTDFKTGRVLDLNASYESMIKPAVEAAGLTCVRADEINHTGVIDVPMYDQLLNADVVVADLSTSNVNAFYELGVRHALRPHTTVIVAEDGMETLAFDLSHVVVRKYKHLGDDIGVKEANRFKTELSAAIRDVLAKDPLEADSPVYTFLKELKRPELAVRQAVQPPPAPAPDTATRGGFDFDAPSYGFLLKQANEAQKKKDFVKAKTLLETLRDVARTARADELAKAQRPGEPTPAPVRDDPGLIQRLALVTYKSEKPTKREALEEARTLLLTLNPQTSNDTETLGLWGAVHKRLWELTPQPEYLDEAVHGYEIGFKIRNDFYNGINYAYLLNVRAAESMASNDLAEACADFILAQRVRREVTGICQKALAAEKARQADDPDGQPDYWLRATLAEAYIGIGNDVEGQKALDEAFLLNPDPQSWERQSTEEQLNKLRALLAQSPLKYIRIE